MILLFSCKPKQEDIKVSGSITLDGTSYPLTSARVIHVGYADVDSACFILHTTFTGYQGSINLFMLAPDNDFLTSVTYDRLATDTLSYIALTESKDTLRITAASLTVDSLDDTKARGKNWLKYTIHLTVEGATADGTFTGPHTVNYTVDQPSYGNLSFDTISVGLARPTLYRWDHFFCDFTNYFELKFYSSTARFSDSGTISQGAQFVLGFHSFQQNYPAAATYPVALEPAEQTMLYGHREGSVNWGTYWQTFYSGSVVGKANILTDTTYVLRWDADSLTIRFSMKDQLGNDVVGSYSGRYY